MILRGNATNETNAIVYLSVCLFVWKDVVNSRYYDVSRVPTYVGSSNNKVCRFDAKKEDGTLTYLRES